MKIEDAKYSKIVIIINCIAITILVIASVYIIFECLLSEPDGSGLDVLETIHVVFCTMGFVGMICANLITTSKWVHIAMGSIGSLLIIVGIALEIYNSEEKWVDFTPFESSHTLMGCATLMFIIIMMVFGIIVFIIGMGWCCSCCEVVYVEMFHDLFGMTAFVLGSFAVCFAIRNNTTYYLTELSERCILYLLIGLSTMWCTIISLIKLAQKLL